jgi:hypothetical protein
MTRDFVFVDLNLFYLEQIPFLIISPNNLIVDYGDQLELICQTNIINLFDIQWLHNGQLINRINYLTHFYDRNILRINKAIDEHTGIYQCFSNNSLNQQLIMSMPVTITVRRECFFCSRYLNLFLYLAHPESQNRAVTAGHRMTLSCEIDPGIKGNFLGIIEWFHNGSPLKMNSANRNRIDYRNGTLTIDQTSVKFSIEYFHSKKFSFIYRVLIQVSINVSFERIMALTWNPITLSIF